MGKQPINASREGDEEEESFVDFVSTQMNKFYVDHIPIDSIKDLPRTCK